MMKYMLDQYSDKSTCLQSHGLFWHTSVGMVEGRFSYLNNNRMILQNFLFLCLVQDTKNNYVPTLSFETCLQVPGAALKVFAF